MATVYCGLSPAPPRLVKKQLYNVAKYIYNKMKYGNVFSYAIICVAVYIYLSKIETN